MKTIIKAAYFEPAIYISLENNKKIDAEKKKEKSRKKEKGDSVS